MSTYWKNMTPEQRSAEMKRRRAKAAANKRAAAEIATPSHEPRLFMSQEFRKLGDWLYSLVFTAK